MTSVDGMSDTPRTDAASTREGIWVYRAFASKLERELNEALKSVKQVQLDAYKQGMTDAAASLVEQRFYEAAAEIILTARDKKTSL